jgi:hypothetical protein
MLRINNNTHSIHHYVIHTLIAADYSESENEDDDDNNNKITVHNRNIK